VGGRIIVRVDLIRVESSANFMTVKRVAYLYVRSRIVSLCVCLDHLLILLSVFSVTVQVLISNESYHEYI